MNDFLQHLPPIEKKWFALISYVLLTISLNIILRWIPRKSKDDENRILDDSPMESSQMPKYSSLVQRYLAAYFLAAFGDWLQGPYMYELYNFYGYTKQQIGFFYIIGNLSSLIFGSTIGMLSDGIGRKKSCLLYCACSVISSLVLNYNCLQSLALNRFLSGIASSLFSTSFDAWIIYEHNIRNSFPSRYIRGIYSICTFSSGIFAIMAGIIASIIAQKSTLPNIFNLSAMFSLLSFIIILTTWDENYGSTQENNFIRNIKQSFKSISQHFHSRKELWFAVMLQSLFDNMVQILILIWTPSINSQYDPGLVYTYLMTSIMLGSSLSAALPLKWHYIFGQVYVYMTISSIAFLVASMSEGIALVYCFCVFEFCVGAHLTSYYSIRASFILPKNSQATILTIFRLPSHLFIFTIYLTWSYISLKTLMKVASLFAILALICFRIIHKKVHHLVDEDPNLSKPLLKS